MLVWVSGSSILTKGCVFLPGLEVGGSGTVVRRKGGKKSVQCRIQGRPLDGYLSQRFVAAAAPPKEAISKPVSGTAFLCSRRFANSYLVPIFSRNQQGGSCLLLALLGQPK